MKNFMKKASAFVLAAAMTISLAPAQTLAAEPEDTAEGSFSWLRTDAASSLGLDAEAIAEKEYTVIKGNAPVLPKKVNITSNDGTIVPTEIQWDAWDKDIEAGTYETTGTAGEEEITVTVKVLPCDEAVPDVSATGKSNGTAQEKLDAIHSLRGYKGLFVAEYDIVPDAEKGITDRAVIYLPETLNDGSQLDAGNCWDTGARLQFKYINNNTTYFQTQIGDGKVVDNARYYPTNEELDEALGKGETVSALPFDEVSVYRVRVVMDTVTDKNKGNYKVYITDPQGIEHEVTQPGGNGFRIYPKDGVIKKFAAVRGSYRLTNHKISWISGYATKKVETYFKAQDAEEYAKEGEDTVTKELPGVMREQPEAERIKDGRRYVLDTEKSGWYRGEEKVDDSTANEGQTIIFRSYYNENVVNKTELNEKIQKAENQKGEDYTAVSWKEYTDALENARQVNEETLATQTDVDTAVQRLDAAEAKLVNIKNLKAAVDRLKKELEEKEAQKAEYVNWDQVKNAVEEAEKVLQKPGALKDEVEAAEAKTDISLLTQTQVETEAAKNAMEHSVAAAEQKISQIKEADYTPASWRALQDALQACAKLNSATASKADYTARKEALDRALAGLLKRADKTALHQAIAAANALREADYEAAGFQQMRQKLAAANTVSADADAAQAEVDKAVKDLQNAVNGLVKKEKVTSVKPAAKVYKIAAGRKLDLKNVFHVLPKNAGNKKLTYFMDKKYSKYASMKSGVVTLKKKGAGKTVVIKAEAADGSGRKATVKIKIMKNAVTKITVKKKTLTVKAGQKAVLRPKVKTNGKNANKTLEYISSNQKLATVKNGVVSTKKGKSGKVTITVKSTDGTGKSVKVKINIKK